MTASTPPDISVVIPTYNEANHLSAPIRSARQGNATVEVIVVDGGSNDGTLREAERLADRTLQTEAGRGRQMNEGARAAAADTLLFLHADTLLPPNFADVVERVLSRNGVVAGAFRLSIQDRRPSLRLVERLVHLRSRVAQLPYGDQSLFLKRKQFNDIGRFPEQPLMEDVELVSRLRKRGRIFIARDAVDTSPRRWNRNGVLKTTVLNLLCLTAYMAGVSPTRLANWYYPEGEPEQPTR